VVTRSKLLGGLVAALPLVLASGGRAAAAVEVHPDFSALKQGESAEETFELNALGLIEVSYIIQNNLGATPKEWRPFVGKYRKEISRERFLELIGRQDLLDALSRRRWIGAGVLVVGAAAVVIGGYKVLNAPDHGDFPVAAGVAAGAGALTIGVGIALVSSQSAMRQDDAVEATIRYNDALRAHLGLPPAASGPGAQRARPPSPGARLLSALRLGVAPGGATMGLELSF
jgi:hypothetical protein